VVCKEFNRIRRNKCFMDIILSSEEILVHPPCLAFVYSRCFVINL
jgi:hypothetical protein